MRAPPPRPRCAPRRALRRAGAAAAVIGAVFAQAACAELGPIENGACGNAVVDPNEDCDRFAIGDGTVCAPPGDPRQCRFVCTKGAACPAGYGCGSDGVCRRGYGQFVALGEQLVLPSVQELVAGDVDGDGVEEVLALSNQDILGRRTARVLYSPSSMSAGPVELGVPVLLGAVAVDEIDGDPAKEVGFTDVSGVGLLNVRADQQIEFAAFPAVLPEGGTSLRGLPLDVIPKEPGDELVTFVNSSKGIVEVRRPAGVLPSLTIATVSGDVGELAGRVQKGRFGDVPPCEALVFAFKGAAEARVVRPCRAGGSGVEWNEGGSAEAIALPAGEVVGDRGTELADMDLDGYLDVLIASPSGLFVAWGRADGSFSSAPGGAGTKGAAGPFALPKMAGVPGTVPLAVADLNNDHVIDFVVPRGVVVSSGASYAFAYETLGVPWATAIVADLNANGLLDVAAAPESSLDLDFLNNAGGGVLNPTILLTDGPIVQLAAGDFDGDLIQDVACVVALDEAEQGTSEVELLFGNPNGPPASPVLLTQLPGVRALHVGHLTVLGGAAGQAVADGLADLVVVSRSDEDDTDKLFAFRGNGARFMTAALPLRTAENAARPVALTAGRFGDATADLAVLGADMKTGDLHLWRVEAAKDVKLSELIPSSPFDAGFKIEQGSPQLLLQFGAAMAAGDLHKESNDDLVIVASYGEQKERAALVVAHYRADKFTFELESLRPLDAVMRPGSGLQLRDVDGDGELDALLYTGGDKDGRALLLWNDGGVGIDVSAPAVLDPGQAVTGLGCLPAASGCEPLVLTSGGAYRGRLTGGRGITLEHLADLPGGRALALGDFDHDGVVDAAVGGALGVQLFRSLPERP